MYWSSDEDVYVWRRTLHTCKGIVSIKVHLEQIISTQNCDSQMYNEEYLGKEENAGCKPGVLQEERVTLF
jgi:hypothetical protein